MLYGIGLRTLAHKQQGNQLEKEWMKRYSAAALAVGPWLTAIVTGSSQSCGGRWIPQTFPGSSRARPKSQRLLPFSTEMQFTTRAPTQRAGRPSSRTVVPTSTGRLNLTAHPWGFTRMTRHSSGSEQPGTRIDAAISQLIRVPPRLGLLIIIIECRAAAAGYSIPSIL